VLGLKSAIKKNLIINPLLFGTFLFLTGDLNAQTNSIQTGSTNSLKVSLSNTIGVTTSADSTDNLEIENQAVLILEPGSSIQDSFGEGDEQGQSVSASFDISPNGSSVGIAGLQAENNYIIGEGTYFSSTMKTKDEENTTAIKGDASAGLYHDMTLKIDQTVSSFTSSFSQNF
jgi:hypothetical protein